MGSTSQQFCLKWNNHSSNMLNVFETLLTSEQLVDVTLACDGLSLKAHKMVLSACSPFFQSLFQENPCKHPIVILKDIRYTDLKAIIDFMYKGEVNVGQAHLSALLKTAETLKVKGLAEVSGEDGQSSSGSVVQQEVPVFPQAQHSSDVANIVQTIDSSVRPSSDSPTGRKRKRTKWKNRAGQSGGNDSETDDQGPAAKNQEIVSAEVIEDDSSSIGVVEPSDTRNAKESRIIIEEATIVGDYVEPAALMEQNMTTDNVQPVSSQLMLTNATSKDNNINVPESRSYDTTVATMNPETVDLIDRPEDVKPTALVSYEEPPMSPNATSSHHSQDDSNSMTMYMDPNSMPAIAGPSNYQQDKQPSASAGQVISVGRNKKGDPLIFCDGFLYRSYYNKWRCSCTIDQKCPGMLHTVNFKDPYLLVKHTHPPLTNFLELLEEVPGLSGKVKQQISSELSILPVEGTTWSEPTDESQSAPPPVMGYWTPMAQQQPQMNLPALMQNPNILTQKRIPKPSVRLSFKTSYIPSQSLRKRGRPRKSPNDPSSYKPYATKYYNSKTNSLSSVYMYKKASKFFNQNDSSTTSSLTGADSSTQTTSFALSRPLTYKSALKRGKVGRPRKSALVDTPLIKKKRGRPRKVPVPNEEPLNDSPMIKIEKLDDYIPATEWLSVFKKEPGEISEEDSESPSITTTETSFNESEPSCSKESTSGGKDIFSSLVNLTTSRVTKPLQEFEPPRPPEMAMKPPKPQRFIKPGRVVVTPAKSARMKTIPSEEYRARDHEVPPPAKIVMPPVSEDSNNK